MSERKSRDDDKVNGGEWFGKPYGVQRNQLWASNAVQTCNSREGQKLGGLLRAVHRIRVRGCPRKGCSSYPTAHDGSDSSKIIQPVQENENAIRSPGTGQEPNSFTGRFSQGFSG
jgi:hypothetical protein